MDELIEAIIQSPKLPEVTRRLDEVLRQEQKKRRIFHEQLARHEGQKVEFINGEKVIHMPATSGHLSIFYLLIRLLSAFVDLHRLGLVFGEKALISLTRNDYEPDIVFWNSAKADLIEPKQQLRFPPPDFVVEILSKSTERVDRGIKFEDYAANGIAEYWIIDPEEEFIEQYLLRDGAYVLNFKSRDGMIASVVIANFEIPVRAIFDEQENLAALQRLLAPK